MKLPPGTPSTCEQGFLTHWSIGRAQGIVKEHIPDPVREFKFSMYRDWKFDFCWQNLFVAVEVEGLIGGKGGRHQRVSGYTKDVEKYNAAALLCWSVLRYTNKDLKARPLQIIEELAGLLERRYKVIRG